MTEGRQYVVTFDVCVSVGLFITILIIEYIGRRFTMALEFFVFALFVLLVNFCVARYDQSLICLTSDSCSTELIVLVTAGNLEVNLSTLMDLVEVNSC